MEDSLHGSALRNNSEAGSVITGEKVSKRGVVASGPKAFSQETFRRIASLSHGGIGNGAAGHVALFLLKVAALETVRRFSRAKCPFAWRGIQALQVLCYPPLKWIQRWFPFKGLVKGMQSVSRPLLVLSIATAFSDQAESSNEISDNISDSHASSELHSELSPIQSTLDTRFCDETPQSMASENWLIQLHKELENQGISLPERINEDELRRFNTVANGDLSRLLSSIKKTIRWRETYKMLSKQELEMWSNMIFWHGFDIKHQPCLVVRLGLACSSLPFRDRPRISQALQPNDHLPLLLLMMEKVCPKNQEKIFPLFKKASLAWCTKLYNVINYQCVSQVEYGILQLVDAQNPRITVLVDCEGLSPFRFPMQMLRSCSSLLEDHFPNRLGSVFIIRLPPVVRVFAQTFVQVLKPATRKKLKFEGEAYQKVLSDFLLTLPSYLGGKCTCITCSNISVHVMPTSHTNKINSLASSADVNESEDQPLPHPAYETDVYMYGNCDQVLRTAVIGILILWVLAAFIERL